MYGTWSLMSPSASVAQMKTIFGWVEKVQIFPERVVLKAKLDTGAKTSSLNAVELTSFQKNGEKWVRFNVIDPESHKKVEFERRVVRMVKIKEHDGPPQTRPVVLMDICLGWMLEETEMSLIDRTSFNYQMLLGRKMLSGKVIVDPSVKFTARPTCERTTKP